MSCMRIENCSNMYSKIGIQQYTIEHLYVECIQLIGIISLCGLATKRINLFREAAKKFPPLMARPIRGVGGKGRAIKEKTFFKD